MTPDAGAQPGELSPADRSGPRELLRYRSAQGRWVVVAMILGSSVAGIDSTVVAVALPARHASRVRGADGWTGPGGLHARFGRDAAHAGWSCAFRLAIKTDLGSRIVRARGIVPATVNERDVADGLLENRAAATRPARR